MTKQYRALPFFRIPSPRVLSTHPLPHPRSTTLTVFVASTLSAFLVPTSRKGIPILNKSFLTAATSLLSFPPPSALAQFRLPLSSRLPYLTPLSSILLLSRSTRLNFSVIFVPRTANVVDSRFAFTQNASRLLLHRYFVYNPSLIAGIFSPYTILGCSIRRPGDKIALVF